MFLDKGTIIGSMLLLAACGNCGVDLAYVAHGRPAGAIQCRPGHYGYGGGHYARPAGPVYVVPALYHQPVYVQPQQVRYVNTYQNPYWWPINTPR